MATLYTKEGTGAVYTATLEDADGTAIPLANLTTITLTLYDVTSGDIINSREDQDVKNTNNVTVNATSGLLTWAMQAADNPIVNEATDVGEREEHKALFEFTFSGTGSPGTHVAKISVLNLGKVTQAN
jgi:hypothetical protein